MATTSTRSERRFHNEAMEIIIGCFVGLGLLSAMLPQVALGPIGLMLLASGSLTALLYVIGTVRQGGKVHRSILIVLAAAACGYGLSYVCVWYFTHYLASQPDLFKFNLKGR